VSVCDLGTSSNSRPSLQFTCSTTERKYHKVYLQTLELQSDSFCSSSTVRLVQACGSFCRVHFIISFAFSVVWIFVGYIGLRVEGKHDFMEIRVRRDINLCVASYL
jgi:hypothetical protein